MYNLVKSFFLFIIILLVAACNKPECNVNDFVGTANGTWTESGGTCIAGFPNSFELKTDPALRNDENVGIFIADTLAYTLIFNGPNDEGCLFNLFTAEDNRQSIGSGNLNGDNLTLGIFVGTSSNIGCSFAGKIEK